MMPAVEPQPARQIFIRCPCGTEIPAIEADIVDVTCPNCGKLWQWRRDVEKWKASHL